MSAAAGFAPRPLAEPAPAPAIGALLSGLLICLFLAGYYVYADLPLAPGLRLPAAGAVVGGWGLLAWHLGRLRRGDLAFAGAAVSVALLSLAANPAFYESPALRPYMGDYATSFMVFLVSLPMALGMIAALRLARPGVIANAALAAVLLLLAGVAAERFAGLAALSDPVRALLFPPEIVYAEDLRDRLLYGAVRAKLFTSEPSHVAKAFVLAILVWYAAEAGRWQAPLFYLLLAAGVALIKSPGILAVLPAAWAAELCRLRRTGWAVVLVLAGAVAVVGGVLAAQALFPERLAHIASGRDGSFLIRALLPWEVLCRVWTEHPLFGLGFGAKESGIPYAIAAAQAMQLDVQALLGTNAPLGNNGLLIGMIQLGPLGSLLFALALLRFWRFACGPYWLFAAAALAGYLTLIGGINDPRFWGGFALITGGAAAAWRREQRPAPQRGVPRPCPPPPPSPRPAPPNG